ncbi:uncharacterized protein LOC107042010 isoform X2 [Diachasma alloeum]|uniref:uncharacterized protein LOC107042010 isoform X2 n=1 Tax=Diachasma alloeum TaxID=454923 RepID=UPI0007381A11|nr:uncharacterized protein LOC107042010 isoform X2 [Diachasma alloeum]
MNTREFIEKITKLPKTNDKSSITIFPQPNVNAGCGSNGVRPPRQVKNPHLVRYDDESMSSEERSAYYSNESSLDDAQISCNILEAYGGEVPSNKAIEDHFKTKQKITSEGPKSRVDQWLYAFEHNSRQNPLAEPFPFIINSCYSTKRNGSSSRKSKSKKQKRDDCEKHAQEVFSKNILMRHILLEKQLESMSLESSSSSTSAKKEKKRQTDRKAAPLGSSEFLSTARAAVLLHSLLPLKSARSGKRQSGNNALGLSQRHCANRATDESWRRSASVRGLKLRNV